MVLLVCYVCIIILYYYLIMSAGGDDIDTEDMEPVDNSPWAGTDRDYTYEEV